MFSRGVGILVFPSGGYLSLPKGRVSRFSRGEGVLVFPSGGCLSFPEGRVS